MALNDEQEPRVYLSGDGSICIEQASPLGGYPDLIALSPGMAAKLGCDLLQLAGEAVPQ